MSIPLGTWKANVNGVECDIVITEVREGGFVEVKFAGSPINGLWNEASQVLTFSYISLNPIFVGLIFTGYLFKTPSAPSAGQDVVWTLAGSVQSAFAVVNQFMTTSARRNVFGWFAQFTEIV